MAVMLPRLPTSSILAFLLVIETTVAFDHDVCLQSALQMLANDTLNPQSPYFFRDRPNSPPYVDAKNMTLTLAGCNAICGRGTTWYPDIGPRLNAWVIPVILLIANVEVSSLGKRNLYELLHLLGDPIDSLWSLLHKIDASDRCRAYAAQFQTLCESCQLIVATVFAGYEEVQGSRITSSQNTLKSLVDQYSLVDRFTDWRHAAVHLADGRTDELVRTVLALILYLYQLLSNFIPAVGGQPSSPPGSRIATSVLLSCFVPAILLTNIVGGFASRRSAFHIINNWSMQATGYALNVAPKTSFFLTSIPVLAQVSTSDYYGALIWSGGIYMYRPWKLRYITSGYTSPLYTISCGILAATPVVVGFIGGSLILWWQTPRGFNCRHIWLITVSSLWITSAIITQVSHNLAFATGKYHWRFVLIKDAIITIPSFAMFFLSTSGLFNSCWCWSGPWEYPGVGRVILPFNDFYQSDGTVMYPMTLFAALLLQLLIVAFVVFRWRRGLRLLRWSEESRQEESARMLGGAVRCNCIVSLQQRKASSLDSQTVLLSSNKTRSSHT